MKAEEAKKIAETFLSTQDMRGHKAVFADVRNNPRQPNDFGVIFNIFSPEGGLVDGPVVVIVDKATREARFF